MFWRTLAIGRVDLSEEERLEKLLKESASAPEKDRDIFDDVDFMRLVVRSNSQAFVQGYNGVWDDGKTSCRPFGFKVKDLTGDLEVQLWYGKEDVFVPPVHGLQIAARLGGRAQLRMEDESHAGIQIHWKREILEALRDSM